MAGKDYSLNALNNFFEYAAKKGLIKENTAMSRKRATNQILSILDQHELVDLREVDINHTFDRFQNLQGTGFRPESLRVYKSRFRKALADFFAYTNDPATFKPIGIQRSSPKAKKESAPREQMTTTGSGEGHRTPKPLSEQGSTLHSDKSISIPVPLRAGLTVSIHNIPADLTSQEAERLAAIVRAYAVPSA